MFGIYIYISLFSRKNIYSFFRTLGGNDSDTLSAFHGWWRITTKSNHYAFFALNYIEFTQHIVADQYIYIDTSTTPVMVNTTWGTLSYPRLYPDALDFV